VRFGNPAGMSDTPKSDGGKQPDETQRRPAEDRRKPRSSFVERIGKARGRRAGEKRDHPPARDADPE
jgi:hypothetical protein